MQASTEIMSSLTSAYTLAARISSMANTFRHRQGPLGALGAGEAEQELAGCCVGAYAPVQSAELPRASSINEPGKVKS